MFLQIDCFGEKIMDKEKIEKEPEELDLYDADPDCEHELDPDCLDGIRCLKCDDWFCF